MVPVPAGVADRPMPTAPRRAPRSMPHAAARIGRRSRPDAAAPRARASPSGSPRPSPLRRRMRWPTSPGTHGGGWRRARSAAGRRQSRTRVRCHRPADRRAGVPPPAARRVPQPRALLPRAAAGAAATTGTGSTRSSRSLAGTTIVAPPIVGRPCDARQLAPRQLRAVRHLPGRARAAADGADRGDRAARAVRVPHRAPRRAGPSTLVPLATARRPLSRKLRDGGLVAIIGDRDLPGRRAAGHRVRPSHHHADRSGRAGLGARRVDRRRALPAHRARSLPRGGRPDRGGRHRRPAEPTSPLPSPSSRGASSATSRRPPSSGGARSSRSGRTSTASAGMSRRTAVQPGPDARGAACGGERGRADMHIHSLYSDGTASVARDPRPRRAPHRPRRDRHHRPRADRRGAARRASSTPPATTRSTSSIGEEVTTRRGHVLALFVTERHPGAAAARRDAARHPRRRRRRDRRAPAGARCR